jgi:hypothetical protein
MVDRGLIAAGTLRAGAGGRQNGPGLRTGYAAGAGGVFPGRGLAARGSADSE